MKQALRQAAVLLALALVPAAIAWWRVPPAKFLATAPTESAEASDAVTLAEAERWSPAPLWIDARTQAEFESGHKPGAVLLNEDTWDALLPGFLAAWRGQRIVVYCSSSCAASRRIAVRLRMAGAGEVNVFSGGWEGWLAAHPGEVEK